MGLHSDIFVKIGGKGWIGTEPVAGWCRPTGMTVLRRISMTVVSCAALGLAVSGCAQQPDNGVPAGNPATTPPASSAAPTPVPSGAGQPVVITGVIKKGVEPGCLVLTTDNGGAQYLVLAKTVPPLGVPVVVHGTTSDELSYCQQGTPLRVDHIDRR